MTIARGVGEVRRTMTAERGRGRGPRRRVVGGAVAVVTLLALWVTACGGDAQAGASGEEATAEGASRVINVEVLTVEPASFTEVIRLTGTVQANQDVVVSAEESGVIRRLFVEKGRAVSAGQPLAKIDDGILRSQVEQARARAALATETWERRQRLWEEDGVGSELAYLEARYAAEEARANLRTLERRLERTTVRAPISGILDDRMVEVGTMVSPGTPVGRILDLTPAKVRGGVPERYATDVEPGSEATARFDALGGQTYTGEVSFVGAAVDRANRTFPVELLIPNPGRAVKPEMVADVSLVRRVLDDALVVPQEALVRTEDGFQVFVVVERGDDLVAEARAVTVGPSQRNRAVVEAGLAAGDRIVVVGQNQVATGDRVRIVRGDEEGAS